jgi:soluble lytic murein transglycosylase-like protein/TolA-binding protein
VRSWQFQTGSMLALVLFAAVIAAAQTDPPGAKEYLAGWNAERVARYGDAVARYEACIAVKGPLGPYACIRLARCRALAKQPEDAARLYQGVIDARPEGPWTRMAQACLAEHLSEANRHAEAHALYEAVLSVRTAPSWLEQYRRDAAENAIADPALRDFGYEIFIDRASTTRWYSVRLDAAKHLAGGPSPRYVMAAAEAYVRSGAYKEAAPLLHRLLPTALMDGSEWRTQWQYLEGRVLIGTKHPDLGRAMLRSVWEEHPDSTWAPWALAHYGRALLDVKTKDDALAALERLLKLYPESESAGDALWRVAQYFQGKNDSVQALAAYLRLGRLCPGHYRADDALMVAASLQVRQKKPKEAIKTYAELRERYPDSAFAAEASYRSAGLRIAAGDTKGARGDYEQAAQDPLGTFHAHRAMGRLAELGNPPEICGKDLKADGRASYVRPILPGKRPLPVYPKDWVDAQWFQRLRFFAANGLEEAEWEALALNDVVKQGESEGLFYHFLAECGLSQMAGELMKESEWGVVDGKPTVDRLRIAFPRAYWPQMTALAKDTGLDPYLLLAMARQESAFRARVGSSAGAQGVMQLMPDTATWLAKVEPAVTTGHASNLHHPGSSIRLGAYYLMRQVDRQDGNLVYALSCYNAGPGNLSKWRKRLPTRDMDRFIEAIPFAETKGYVQRVLGNYAAYHSLYDGLDDKETPPAEDAPEVARASE